MSKRYTVRILEDGTHAREVNPNAHPEALDPAWDMKRKRWSEAESSLKTWEIEDGDVWYNSFLDQTNICKDIGSIHEGEENENGKIKILT